MSIEQRHVQSVAERRVLFAPDRDGMAWLSAYLPADTASGIWARTTAAARAVQGPEEARTLTQLRADQLATWLLEGNTRPDNTGPGNTNPETPNPGTVGPGNTNPGNPNSLGAGLVNAGPASINPMNPNSLGSGAGSTAAGGAAGLGVPVMRRDRFRRFRCARCA